MSVDQIVEETLELLYDDDPEEKLKGTHNIVSLCSDTRNLEDVVENHQLMSALSRLLGESDSLPVELTFNLGKLFLSLSLIEDFHEILSSHRVGALALDVVELELKRASHRGAESECSFTTKQEHIIFILLTILDNLADDFASLRKMIKKSLASLLTRCMQQSSIESLLVTLSLLKKASVFEETAIELSTDGSKAIGQLAHLLTIPCIEMQQHVVAILFNFSFHDECMSLISAENIHTTLVALLQQEPSLYSQTIQLMYHLSSRDEDRQQLLDASSGLMPALMNLLQRHHTAGNGELDERFAGLPVNMTLHPLGSEEFIHLGGISQCFVIIQESQPKTKQNLLKVLRNLSRWTKTLQCQLSRAIEFQDMAPLTGLVKDSAFYIAAEEENMPHTSLYWEKHFWSSHVDFIMQQTLHCKNEDLLVEWVGILSNLTRDDLPGGVQWHDLLNDHHSSLVGLFHKLLDPCIDDLKLELMIWLGELCCSKECSEWIASSNLVDVVNSVFVQSSAIEDDDDQDDEMRLQILLVYERCLLYEETMLQVVSGDGVVDALLECLTGDSYLVSAAETCLMLVEDFDRGEDGTQGEIGSFILEERYERLVRIDVEE